MTGVSQQTLGFLTSASKAIPYDSINHGPSGKSGSSSSSSGSQSFLSTLGSIGSRALDILSRPMYASASLADQLTKQSFGQGQPGTSPLGAIWTGLEGKTKTDFTQVVQDYADLEKQRMANAAAGKGYDNASGWKPGEASVNPWLKLGLGLGGDVFLDPSTYVGPGLIKDIIKAPIVAAKGSTVAIKGTSAAVKGSSVAAKGASTVEDVAANVAHTVDEAQKADEAVHSALPSAQGLLNSPAPTVPIPPSVPPGKAFADELLGGGIRPPSRTEEVTQTFEGPGGPLSPSRDLPTGLQGAKPRFGYGQKLFPLEFADGVTKALYIVRNGKKLSSKDEAYMSFLRDHFIGESDAEIRARGAKVHASIKDMASKANNGQTLVLGQHPAAISKASEDAIKTHQAIAAARDTEQAINALPDAASKQEAGLAANKAAKGDPYLQHVIGETVDRATADVIPTPVKGSEKVLAASVDGTGTGGMRAVADVLDRKSMPLNEQVLNEAGRLANPKNQYNRSGGTRWRDRGVQKYLAHSAGERNTHRLRASLNDAIVGAFQKRGRLMTNSLVHFAEPDREAAFSALKRGLIGNGDPTTIEAANTISAWLNRLLGPLEISPQALQGTTDIHEFGITMKELNHYLPKANQFTAGRVTLKDGRKLDFSKAGDWRNSWQLWDTKDPIEALYQLQSSITKAVAEKSFYASLPGKIPGIEWVGHGAGVAIDHPLEFTKGMVFEPWIVPEVQNWMKSINEFKAMQGKGWRYFDRGQNAWKSVATIINPAHHIRNMIGDSFLSFMHGMTNPAYYAKSARVLSAQHKFVHGFNPTVKDAQDAFTVLDMTKPGAIENVLGKTYEPADRIATVKFGRGKEQDLSIEQVFTMLSHGGVLPHYQTVEDLAQISGKYSPLFKGPFNGRVMQGLGRVSEAREHFERVAYFLYRLEHPRSGRYYSNIREAIDEAIADTKFVHPTGQDLTQFERSTMRRLMPFYSWTRNATPAVLMALAERPGRAIAFYKFEHALALSNGINQPSISDQFPTDQAFPNWIRQGILGPSLGGPGGYTIINPSEPTSSIFQMITDPLHFTAGMLSPAIQVPASLASGSNIGSGAPITSPGTYINQETPITNLIDRITNRNLGPGSLVPETKPKSEGGGLGFPSIQTPSQRKAPDNDVRGLLNWLTGLGMLNTGQYVPGKNVKAKAP